MNKIPFFVSVLLLLVACSPSNITANATVDTAKNSQIVHLGLDRNGYTPSEIVVEAHRPVTFIRDSSLQGCAVYVIQPELGIDANFAKNEKYTFTPTKKGEYTLSCSMGMWTGTLVVV